LRRYTSKTVMILGLPFESTDHPMSQAESPWLYTVLDIVNKASPATQTSHRLQPLSSQPNLGIISKVLVAICLIDQCGSASSIIAPCCSRSSFDYEDNFRIRFNGYWRLSLAQPRTQTSRTGEFSSQDMRG
jgi:hypothetical protein